jgi:outer membrane protein W
VTIVGERDVVLSNFTLLDARVGILVQNAADILVANTIVDGAQTVALDADVISSLDAENNVFRRNLIAIRRGSIETHVRNNIFAENTETVLNIGLTTPEVNIEYNCFFRNADLLQGGVDRGLGTNVRIGDPLFASAVNRDFHLREGSPCIDAGTGLDGIDASVADIGAYGGDLADPFPFPVPRPVADNASANPAPPYRIRLTWEANLAYLVTNTANPGGYFVHYSLNTPGPPYTGADAGGGLLPSPIDVGNVTTYTLDDLMPVASGAGPPTLLLAEPRNSAIALTWSAAQGAAAYRVLYGQAAVGESQIDVGNVTSVTVTGLQNGVSYRFGVASITTPTYFLAVTVRDNTQNANESVFSTEQSITIGPTSASATSNELVGIPEVTAPVPDLPDEGCFIAGAAYSSESAPAVLVLRDFRDRYLKTHAPGRALVRAYYALSPPLARYLDAHPSLKPAVRAVLAPFVAVALFMLESAWPAKLAIAALLCALCAVVYLRPRSGLAAALFAYAFSASAADDQEAGAGRWMVELKAGHIRPALPEYGQFYGDDDTGYYGGAFGYRFRPWLEVGAETQYLHDTGVGRLPSTGGPGAPVEYTLWPAHVFAKFRLERNATQLFVPYVGIGIARAYYKQDIDFQDERDGTTSTGPSVRVGVEISMNRLDPTGDTGALKRTYLFIEAQEFETTVDDVDLGGEALLIGFRFELGGP